MAYKIALYKYELNHPKNEIGMPFYHLNVAMVAPEQQ